MSLRDYLFHEEPGITLYCGDCREVLPLLRCPNTTYCLEACDGRCAASVLVADPPYGIAFKSGWTGAQIVGDADLSLRDAILEIWRGPALVFGSPSQPEPRDVRARLVWHRPGSGMGNLALPWQPDWEVIHVIGEGFVGLVRRSSVYSIPWDTFRGDALHPHQKPLPLLKSLLSVCPPGGVIDPCAGSGTTLEAAKLLNRRAIGIEIEPRYCEIAVRRLRQEVLPL